MSSARGGTTSGGTSNSTSSGLTLPRSSVSAGREPLPTANYLKQSLQELRESNMAVWKEAEIRAAAAAASVLSSNSNRTHKSSTSSMSTIARTTSASGGGDNDNNDSDTKAIETVAKPHRGNIFQTHDSVVGRNNSNNNVFTNPRLLASSLGVPITSSRTSSRGTAASSLVLGGGGSSSRNNRRRSGGDDDGQFEDDKDEEEEAGNGNVRMGEKNGNGSESKTKDMGNFPAASKLMSSSPESTQRAFQWLAVIQNIHISSLQLFLWLHIFFFNMPIYLSIYLYKGSSPLRS
jgi:hypothetical protein